MSIPMLQDAELVFSNNVKTFSLPDKRVEKGTYWLDSFQQSSEIDETTKGRDRTITASAISSLALASSGNHFVLE
jgi:hypothetical protein